MQSMQDYMAVAFFRFRTAFASASYILQNIVLKYM